MSLSVVAFEKVANRYIIVDFMVVKGKIWKGKAVELTEELLIIMG